MTDVVYLKVHHKGPEHIGFIGSWEPANERNDNFEQQKDIGWCIFYALQRGAEKVEVVCGDYDNDYQAYLDFIIAEANK